MGLFFNRKKKDTARVDGRKDDTSEYTVDACARLAGEPIFKNGEATDKTTMALYLVGDDELWVNYSAVEARKQEIKNGINPNPVKPYDELSDVATVNECINIVGSKDSEFSMGTWARSDGKLVRYRLGLVKERRIELGLESPEENEK